ncbi:MAG: GNAT family N-acetyltransferase [Micropepsaceae bacterium]
MGNAGEPVSIQRISDANKDEFARIHAGDNAWCQCVAWWVPNWDGWAQRTAEQNAELRAQLFSSGVRDGFLIYAGPQLVGWCQAWKRNAFSNIRTKFGLPHDDAAWMIGCVLIMREFRGRGIARSALKQITAELAQLGARSIDAYPKRQVHGDDELWNGPESTYLELGFKVVLDDPKRPVLRLSM